MLYQDKDNLPFFERILWSSIVVEDDKIFGIHALLRVLIDQKMCREGDEWNLNTGKR